MTDKEQLAREVDVAEWGWLRAHLERGGLILVSAGLELVEVAAKLAENDANLVNEWIQSAQVTKPSTEQVKAWDLKPHKLFQIVIVSPFVLIKEA